MSYVELLIEIVGEDSLEATKDSWLGKLVEGRCDKPTEEWLGIY